MHTRVQRIQQTNHRRRAHAERKPGAGAEEGRSDEERAKAILTYRNIYVKVRS